MRLQYEPTCIWYPVQKIDLVIWSQINFPHRNRKKFTNFYPQQWRILGSEGCEGSSCKVAPCHKSTLSEPFTP
jgi:hypothetical protein